jgi:hypothetical protein
MELGKWIAVRTVQTKEGIGIPRGTVVEIVKLANGLGYTAKTESGYIHGIWARDVKPGGAFLHTSYAEIY